MVVHSFTSSWMAASIHLSAACLMWAWQLGLLRMSCAKFKCFKDFCCCCCCFAFGFGLFFQGLRSSYQGIWQLLALLLELETKGNEAWRASSSLRCMNVTCMWLENPTPSPFKAAEGAGERESSPGFLHIQAAFLPLGHRLMCREAEQR